MKGNLNLGFVKEGEKIIIECAMCYYLDGGDEDSWDEGDGEFPYLGGEKDPEEENPPFFGKIPPN